MSEAMAGITACHSLRSHAKAVGRIVPLTFEESSQECAGLSLLGLRLNATISPTVAEFLAANLWGVFFLVSLP